MTRFLHTVLGILMLIPCGCTSRFSIKKVTPDAHGDSVEGFRYYLSRPYVVVDKPVLVSERIELVRGDAARGNLKLAARQLRSDQSVELTASELQALRSQMKNYGVVQASAAEQDSEFASQPPAPSVSASTGQPGIASTAGATAQAVPATTAPRTATDTSLKGSIRVVFLPDFEEAYAIRHHNQLSKGNYKLNFRDGWQLTDVSGEFDSTPVALEVLNTIDKAIGAIQTIEEASIDREKAVIEAAQKAQDARKAADNKDGVRQDQDYYQVVTRTWIKPGVYRINKPWEVESGLAPQPASGLLTSMGLTLYEVSERAVGQVEKVSGKLIAVPKTVK